MINFDEHVRAKMFGIIGHMMPNMFAHVIFLFLRPFPLNGSHRLRLGWTFFCVSVCGVQYHENILKDAFT